MNLHPNPESVCAILDKQLDKAVVLSTNLYNTGLRDPHCAVAYRAALACGANVEQAWDAAHQHYLFVLRDNLNRTRDIGRRITDDPLLFNEAKHKRAVRDHEEGFARALALVNPFAVSAAA